MAETTASTPNYGLDASTLAAVREAGVDVKMKGAKTKLGKALGVGEGSAREGLAKADAMSKAAKGIQGTAKEIKEARDKRKEEEKKKQEELDQKKESAEIGFDTVFERMAETGSWASPDLFSSFQEYEEGEKTKYLALVEAGDNKGAQKLLREQASRSSQLANWKQTMEQAFKITQDHELSDLIAGDSPEAVEKRKLLQALANAGGDGAEYKINDKGEMVFMVEGQEIKAKDIDRMMTTALSPVAREEGFATVSLAVDAAVKDDPTLEFDSERYLRANTKTYATELRKNPEAAGSILYDNWAGGSSLADDLTEAIKKPDGGLQFSISLPEGDVYKSADTDGSGDLSIQELAEFTGISTTQRDLMRQIEARELTEEDIKKILQELEKDPKLLAEVAGGWTTAKQEQIHTDAAKKYGDNRLLSLLPKTKEERDALFAKDPEAKEAYDNLVLDMIKRQTEQS
tara:strand:+ start:1897 stop:3273 length:1377 start_codon:yes stop_codon:yes gene_type:complete